MTMVKARDCSTAVRVFEGVIRRQRALNVVESAREGLGLCALLQGQLALQAGHPADAETWFRRATAPGASPDVVRGAFLGLGDVRLAQGGAPRGAGRRAPAAPRGPGAGGGGGGRGGGGGERVGRPRGAGGGPPAPTAGT